MRVWPAAVLAAVFALFGVWAFIGVQHLTGLTTGELPQTKRSGTAQIRSCSSDALYLWLTLTCDAEVQWPGQPAPVTGQVKSVHALSGTVAVNERTVRATRRSTRQEVVTADYPGHSDGTLFFLMMMGFLVVSGGLGFVVGWQVEKRFMPEPPEKPAKLTLESKKRRRSKR
jgi:hypothetical protein